MPMPYEQRKHFFEKWSFCQTRAWRSNAIPIREHTELSLVFQLKRLHGVHEKAVGDHKRTNLSRAPARGQQPHHPRRSGNDLSGTGNQGGGKVDSQQVVLRLFRGLWTREKTTQPRQKCLPSRSLIYVFLVSSHMVLQSRHMHNDRTLAQAHSAFVLTVSLSSSHPKVCCHTG